MESRGAYDARNSSHDELKEKLEKVMDSQERIEGLLKQLENVQIAKEFSNVPKSPDEKQEMFPPIPSPNLLGTQGILVDVKDHKGTFVNGEKGQAIVDTKSLDMHSESESSVKVTTQGQHMPTLSNVPKLSESKNVEDDFVKETYKQNRVPHDSHSQGPMKGQLRATKEQKAKAMQRQNHPNPYPPQPNHPNHCFPRSYPQCTQPSYPPPHLQNHLNLYPPQLNSLNPYPSLYPQNHQFNYPPPCLQNNPNQYPFQPNHPHLYPPRPYSPGHPSNYPPPHLQSYPNHYPLQPNHHPPRPNLRGHSSNYHLPRFQGYPSQYLPQSNYLNPCPLRPTSQNQRFYRSKPPFPKLAISKAELFNYLQNAHQIEKVCPTRASFPKEDSAEDTCDFHSGMVGHSIEDCKGFEKIVKKMIARGELNICDEGRIIVNNSPLNPEEEATSSNKPNTKGH